MKMSAAASQDRLNTPSVNAGKPVNEWVGLSDRKATPVGRPTTDMARVAGMVSRGTARPGQVQAAQMMSQAANQERGIAALEKYYANKKPETEEVPVTTPLAAAASTMGVSVPTVPTAPAPAVIGDQFGSAASNSLMPTVGTINRPPQKKLNTLDALQGSANQMGINSFAPKY